MTIRICAILCFAAAISITMAAQSEPVLVSANIPRHPALACQARIGGVVKLTFTLGANGAEPTDVEAVSGPTSLKAAALENVKTWRFGTHYAGGKYETTLDYQFPMSGPEKVTFESFRRVEVATCLPTLVNECTRLFAAIVVSLERLRQFFHDLPSAALTVISKTDYS